LPDLFPDAPLAVSIDDQIAEAKREIGYRKHVYARQVSAGKLKQEAADRKIAVMRAIQNTLERIKEVGVEVLK
jgi:hypothetical protein